GFWSQGSRRQPSVALWESTRRGQLVDSFASHVYGYTPDGGGLGDISVHTRRDDALDGSAARIEADLTLAGPKGTRTASLLAYIPAAASALRPVPALLGLNFVGNHATATEPDVCTPTSGERIGAAHGQRIAQHGAQARRWPYSLIVGRGYGVATLWYEEIEIDLPGFASAGVRGLFGECADRDAQGWGAIGAWAWGLSRALDALSQLSEIDGSSIVAVGHSRLGKAALWAAAQDERFAGVISNESGCGGASLFRHKGIEDIGVITSVRPHWFAQRFADYRYAEERLPVDQHQLLALQAPRPTHVASASRDAGADPRGEFLSTLHASPVFELYGHRGTLARGSVAPGHDLLADTAVAVAVPTPGTRIGGRLSYHLRDGEHDMLAEDWVHILDFADDNLRPRA
ncbi:MAG TPA: hypothetical protein VGJ07_08720, partial [Rugosimonospora sp.]